MNSMTIESTVESSLLKHFSPFDSLSDEYLASVLPHAKQHQLTAGKMLFKRGKPLDSSYYLLSGEVDLIGADFKALSVSANDEQAQQPLNSSRVSAVSAIAKSTVTYLEVDSEFLDRALAWSQSGSFTQADDSKQQSDDSDWMSALLESPLFMQVPPANIQQLFVRFQSLDKNAGDIIVKEGEPGDYFYVVQRGQVRVHSKISKVDVTLQAGQYFGEEALVGETTRNASVTMLTDGELMRLDKENFTALLQQPVLKYIDAAALASLQAEHQQTLIIDVRMPFEYRHGHVDNSRNVPLAKLRQYLSELQRDHYCVITDDGGSRSAVAAHLLAQTGIDARILENSHEHYA